jgi:aldose 1-epimerase
MADRLELGDGRWSIVVAPAQGGSLAACTHEGLEVLKPVDQPTGDSGRAHACCHFPLVPYSNRVEHSRFPFDGETISLRPNVAGSPHAMHGHGWQRAWQVTDSDSRRCALALVREATPDWPWSYRARQEISLEGGSLRLTLAIENAGSRDMPCGLGFHPFLPRSDESRLTFQAARVGNRHVPTLPTGQVPIDAALDFRDGPKLSERLGIDHCYEGWTGRAVVSGGHGEPGFYLEGSEATRFLIVYVPAGEDYYCVEPVTHAVNAMNRPDAAAQGWWRLAPGEARRITMRITPRDS